QSVKNRYLASAYRQLTSNFSVLIRYGVADGTADWRRADQVDEAVQAGTADEGPRGANAYFTKEKRAGAIWARRGGTAESPARRPLPGEAKPMVKQMLGRIDSATDAAQVQQLIGRLDQMGAQVPAEMKPALDYVRARAEARILALNKK